MTSQRQNQLSDNVGGLQILLRAPAATGVSVILWARRIKHSIGLVSSSPV